MTPLAWWVLLTMLFGHARIVPARTYIFNNACVVLCRAENLSVNEDEVHVTSQLVEEGRRGREVDDLLNRLCLVSVERRHYCRNLFQYLRDRERCDCRKIYPSLSLNNRKEESIDRLRISTKLSDKFQQSQQQQQQQKQRQQIQKQEGQRQEVQRLMMTKMRMMMNGRDIMKDENFVPRTMDVNNNQQASSAPNSSTSDEIDWDMWCMAQCNIGHGGSACNCDIIP
ncbi:uncharacterized protein LOC124428499 [Vespa crabro]|uniref:uncharacterized protein LOC124428499 n=1 Tax=Vespa crabro TaxID=7445 RepID=UPI001F004EDC|nr:uncharacterized protein LOC124428499 [Vespa crabro]XP_046828577.1 uncharacterized protein LOC124428499 [Vespa crabro]